MKYLLTLTVSKLVLRRKSILFFLFCLCMIVCTCDATSPEKTDFYTVEQAKAICSSLSEKLTPWRDVESRCFTALTDFDKLSEEEKERTVLKIADEIKQLSRGSVLIENPTELYQQDRHFVLQWHLYKCKVFLEKKFICELTKTLNERTGYERFVLAFQKAMDATGPKIYTACPDAWNYSIIEVNGRLPSIPPNAMKYGIAIPGGFIGTPTKPYQIYAAHRLHYGYIYPASILAAIDSYRDNRSVAFLYEMVSRAPNTIGIKFYGLAGDDTSLAYWALGVLMLSPRDAQLEKKIENQFQFLTKDLGKIPSFSLSLDDNRRCDTQKIIPESYDPQKQSNLLYIMSLKYCHNVHEYKTSLTPNELKDFESLENGVRGWWIRYACAPKTHHMPASSLAGQPELNSKNPKHILFFLEHFPFALVTWKIIDLCRKDAEIQAGLLLLQKNNDFMTEEQHRLAKLLTSKKEPKQERRRH